MANRADNNLGIRKRLAAKLLREAAKDIREAKCPFVAEETMKVAAQYLYDLPGILSRLMPDDRSNGAADEAARLRREEAIRQAVEELRQLREREARLH